MALVSKPGGPRPVSLREGEVRSRFEVCWNAAGNKSGAHKGSVLYSGRGLQSLITALRRAEKGPTAPAATANDALFLVKSWGVPDGELEHYAVEKEKVRSRGPLPHFAGASAAVENERPRAHAHAREHAREHARARVRARRSRAIQLARPLLLAPAVPRLLAPHSY